MAFIAKLVANWTSSLPSWRKMSIERRQDFSVSLDRGNRWLNVDPTRMEQVVTNPLTNAAKNTVDGGRTWLSAGHQEGEIITVKDTGVGLSMVDNKMLTKSNAF
jgi:signal transduction histidine kinase